MERFNNSSLGLRLNALKYTLTQKNARGCSEKDGQGQLGLQSPAPVLPEGHIA